MQILLPAALPQLAPRRAAFLIANTNRGAERAVSSGRISRPRFVYIAAHTHCAHTQVKHTHSRRAHIRSGLLTLALDTLSLRLCSTGRAKYSAKSNVESNRSNPKKPQTHTHLCFLFHTDTINSCTDTRVEPRDTENHRQILANVARASSCENRFGRTFSTKWNIRN